MDIQVLDDFVTEEQFRLIKDTMTGDECIFPWVYNSEKVFSDEEHLPYNFQFNHVFYDKHNPRSQFIHILDPVLMKIDASAIVRIKANLTPRTPERVVYGMHVDYKDAPGVKSAVYYLDDSDGVTLFEDGAEVASKPNRLVIFDSSVPHTGTSCTDQKVRCVINFNFYNWR